MEDQKGNSFEFFPRKSVRITLKDREASLNSLEEICLPYRYRQIMSVNQG